MTSFYSIVRFVPDPLAEEFVNVGIVAFGDGRLRARFVKHLHRAQRFCDRDVSFLRGLERWVTEAAAEQIRMMMPGDVELTEEVLRQLTAEWSNQVQLSPPRAATLAPEALIAALAPRFLREQETPPKNAGRPRARQLAINSVVRAVRSRLPYDAEKLLHNDYPLKGELVEHEFDIGIANGKPIGVAQGISFQVQQNADLTRQIDALAFALIDIKKQFKDLPVGVVTLRPKKESSAYLRATYSLQKLGATMLTEETVDAWSERMAAQAEQHLGPGL